MNDIEQRVKTVVAEQLNLPIEDVKNESDIRDNLYADDSDIIEIITALEDEFHIEIFDPEFFEKVIAVQQVIDHITRKLWVN